MQLAFLLFSSFVAIAFFVGSLVLMNFGHHLGARDIARSGNEALTGLGSVEAAVFALMGLILAFSISGALQRFDERRLLILKEGNAVATAYDRLDLFANELGRPLKTNVKDYFRARIDLYHEKIGFSFVEGAEVASPVEMAKIDKLKLEIWERTVAACKQPTNIGICQMILPSLNEMFDTARLRNGANERHPPYAIYVMLFVLGLGSSFLAGVTMASGKRKSWVHMGTFAGALALALFVIIDIEFPRLGFIRVDTSMTSFWPSFSVCEWAGLPRRRRANIAA